MDNMKKEVTYKNIANDAYSCVVKRGLVDDKTKPEDQAICIIGEIGELLQAVQRKQLDNIKKECADIFIATCVYMKISDRWVDVSHDDCKDGYSRMLKGGSIDECKYIIEKLEGICVMYRSCNKNIQNKLTHSALSICYTISTVFNFNIDEAINVKMQYNENR